MTRGLWIGIGAAVVVGWLGTAVYALDDAVLLRLDVLDPVLNTTIQSRQPVILGVSIALLLSATLGAWLGARATPASRVRALALPAGGIGLAIATLTLVGPLGLASSYDALHAPKHRPASQMGFAPTDWIVAVERNGTEVIYPLELLERHLAINDRVGGEPVLMTWCFSCNSPMAYRAEASAGALSFDVVGIHDIDAILEDRQTGTWWDEGTGKAVGGTLQGEVLKRIPATMVQWRHWQGDPSAAHVAVGADERSQTASASEERR